MPKYPIDVSKTGPSVIHFRFGNIRMRELHGLVSGQWPDICRLSDQHRLVKVYHDRMECIELGPRISD